MGEHRDFVGLAVHGDLPHNHPGVVIDRRHQVPGQPACPEGSAQGFPVQSQRPPHTGLRGAPGGPIPYRGVHLVTTEPLQSPAQARLTRWVTTDPRADSTRGSPIAVNERAPASTAHSATPGSSSSCGAHHGEHAGRAHRTAHSARRCHPPDAHQQQRPAGQAQGRSAMMLRRAWSLKGDQTA